MDIIKTGLTVVGLVVTVSVITWATIKLLAKHGSFIVSMCKTADRAISSSIKKIV